MALECAARSKSENETLFGSEEVCGDALLEEPQRGGACLLTENAPKVMKSTFARGSEDTEAPSGNFLGLLGTPAARPARYAGSGARVVQA